MMRLILWTWRTSKQYRHARDQWKLSCEDAVQQLDDQCKTTNNLRSVITQLEASLRSANAQIEMLKHQTDIDNKTIENLTLVITRDRERVKAELALYSGVAEGVLPGVSNVGARVTSIVSPTG